MKIIFDNIVFSLQKAGGISVFWYEIISKLILDEEFDAYFIEYKNNRQNIFARELNINNSKIFQKTDLLLSVKRYLNICVKMNKKFIFHSSYYRTNFNRKAINVTTVHDFTYEKYSKGIKRWLHCKQKYHAINKSDIIVCISENTKNDLLTYLPKTNINKIRVIYNGVSDDYFRLTENELNNTSNSFSYVLYIGSRESYKRFDLAVKALINMI